MPRMWNALAVRMAARLWHAFIMKPSVHTSAQSRCRWNEHRITETEKTISLTHPRTTTADISRTPEHTGNMSSGVEACVCKLKSIHRSYRKSDKERRAASVFLIIAVSYNARYAKLRGAKKPISRIFGVPASAGSLLGLVQSFYTFCVIYHVLSFYLSHTFRCFLCYALLHRFVCNSFIPVSIYALAL